MISHAEMVAEIRAGRSVLLPAIRAKDGSFDHPGGVVSTLAALPGPEVLAKVPTVDPHAPPEVQKAQAEADAAAQREAADQLRAEKAELEARIAFLEQDKAPEDRGKGTPRK